MKKTEKFLWLVGTILVVLIVGTSLYKKNQAVDVTGLIKASEQKVSTTLGVNLVSCPEMAAKVFEYGTAKDAVTVNGDSEKGVGVVYISGIQNGFRVEDKKYSMFGVRIGDSRLGMDSNFTYQYEGKFEIDEAIDSEEARKHSDFPVVYYNKANNDCVIVSCHKGTGNVVAITYYNNMKKVLARVDM